MTDRPVQLVWQGDGFKPANSYWAGICDKRFVVGQRYAVAEYHERSQASHSHFFACVRDYWQNLPEGEAENHPTPEHLRKRALIATGFYDERILVVSDAEEAKRVVAFIRPIDEFSLVSVNGNIVVERKPQSQSYRAMGKKRFKESKDAVLDWCAALVGVDAETMSRNAGRAA